MMRGVKNVIRDQSVEHGQEVALAEVGVAVRHVLGYLLSANQEETVRSFSCRVVPGSRPLALSDVRSAAAYAGRLTAERELSPHMAVHLAGARGVKDVVSIEDVQRLAPHILDLMANGHSREDILRQEPGLTPELLKASLLYAISLLHEERFPPLSPEPTSESYLRELLPPQDRELLEDYVRVKGQATPERQLSGWIDLVLAVEATYDDIIEEYELDLWHRDELEDQLLICSATAQEQVRPLVLPWDKRFEAAATTIAEPLMSRGGRWEGRRWWWYRIPRRRGKRITSDLQEIGVIERSPPAPP